MLPGKLVSVARMHDNAGDIAAGSIGFAPLTVFFPVSLMHAPRCH